MKVGEVSFITYIGNWQRILSRSKRVLSVEPPSDETLSGQFTTTPPAVARGREHGGTMSAPTGGSTTSSSSNGGIVGWVALACALLAIVLSIKSCANDNGNQTAVESLTGTVESLVGTVERHDREILDLHQNTNAIRGDVDNLNRRMGEVEGRVNGLEGRTRRIESRVRALESRPIATPSATTAPVDGVFIPGPVTVRRGPSS